MSKRTISVMNKKNSHSRYRLRSLLLSALSVGILITANGVYAGAIHDANLFTANTLAANDDSSTGAVNIGFGINFYGSTYNQLFVNNNGNVTFSAPMGTFTPFDLLSTSTPILAPFFADVDTTGIGSGLVQYGQNTLGGRSVFGVNWINVGYFPGQTDKLNSFQLILVNRADIHSGDFDFEFNYDTIKWETGGASGGVGGLGGNSARAGWSDGTTHSNELAGSAVNGALLDGGPNSLTAGSLGSNIPGRYIYMVRSGQVGSALDFDLSLSSTGHAVSSALRNSELVMNGAHGRSLARLTEPGQNTFWVAGDWGRDDHGGHAGSLGLAECGLGRNFGNVQLNAGVGELWNGQWLPLEGRFTHRGTYLLAEVMTPLKATGKDGVWLTVGGYYNWGSADIRRGYVINGNQYDFSTGKPDLELSSLRARVDGNNLFKTAYNISMSPYAELALNRIILNSYTERGGSFPAFFNKRKQLSSDLRVGLDAAEPIKNNMHLVGRLELNHRLNTHGPGTNGDLLTVSTFNYTGVSYKRTWLRVGVGLEGKVGKGIGSLMLNATSQGEAPSSWIAANWQVPI